MKIALFGGSFDPVHREHVRLAHTAIDALGLDKLIVMPSFRAPHKAFGAHADGRDRLEMCRIAFGDRCEVSDEELRRGGTSYTYLTCRALLARYPADARYLLVGADMLEDFFTWRCPEEILRCATLVACGRETAVPPALAEKFRARFSYDVPLLPFVGEAISSTALRVALAFPEEGKGDLTPLDPAVLAYIRARGLYAYPQAAALALEKPERRAHSYRVAKLACARAKSLGIPEEKALVAAMLHDCAKSVPQGSPLLAGFTPPDDVPAPVLHQYTGAYLAEHAFGVSDGEILDAIRYHASGREDMTPLGKLLYLADLLEEARDFAGVEGLRKLFFEDLDACLRAAFAHQLAYLERSGGPVYGRTAAAYEWAKAHLKC